ncbi:MAG: DUF2227 family putative metal-binding protein [Cyanobacteria bacterium P01_F01_bin.3]
MKNLDSLLGSDRPGHLFAAFMVGIWLIAVGLLLPLYWLASVGVVVIFWEWACTADVDFANNRKPLTKLRNAMRKRGSPCIKLMRICGGLMWCLICWAWMPYGHMVKHRSKYSHSLAYGLPCRFVYTLLPLLFLAWLLQPAFFQWLISDAVLLITSGDAAQWFGRGAELFSRGHTLDSLWVFINASIFVFGDIWSVVQLVGSRWSVLIVGAAIADVVHLAKDGYSLEMMIFGR